MNLVYSNIHHRFGKDVPDATQPMGDCVRKNLPLDFVASFLRGFVASRDKCSDFYFRSSRPEKKPESTTLRAASSISIRLFPFRSSFIHFSREKYWRYSV
jgi:hypothetical protein